MIDYFDEETRLAKCYANQYEGAFPQIGEIHAFFKKPILLFFRNSPIGETPRKIFARNGSNDAVSRKNVFFV